MTTLRVHHLVRHHRAPPPPRRQQREMPSGIGFAHVDCEARTPTHRCRLPAADRINKSPCTNRGFPRQNDDDEQHLRQRFRDQHKDHVFPSQRSTSLVVFNQACSALWPKSGDGIELFYLGYSAQSGRFPITRRPSDVNRSVATSDRSKSWHFREGSLELNEEGHLWPMSRHSSGAIESILTIVWLASPEIF